MALQRRAVSMCGCGFMGVYHAGAVAGLRDGNHLASVTSAGVVGASAGAVVGAIVASGGLEEADFLERYLPAVLDGAVRARREPLGLLTPGFRLLDQVASVLDKELPDDAHLQAKGRLHVAVTTAGGGRLPRQGFISEFPTRAALLEAVLRSCAIPGVTAGLQVPGGGLLTHRTALGVFGGIGGGTHTAHPSPTLAIDGGLVNNWPAHPSVASDETLFIAPFAGAGFDISPAVTEPLASLQSPAMMGMSLEISLRNATTALHGFMPPKPEVLEAAAERGYRDALVWCAAVDAKAAEAAAAAAAAKAG